MTYVIMGLGAATASRLTEVEAQLQTAQAEQQRLLDQWNDAEFKNPPDRAKQQSLEGPITAANQKVNALRAELRRLRGTRLDTGPIDAGEIEITGRQPSVLPWVIGGVAVVLAIGALTRKKTIAPI